MKIISSVIPAKAGISYAGRVLNLGQKSGTLVGGFRTFREKRNSGMTMCVRSFSHFLSFLRRQESPAPRDFARETKRPAIQVGNDGVVGMTISLNGRFFRAYEFVVQSGYSTTQACGDVPGRQQRS
ncbi:MAG: hypothetical protein WD077_09390 [Bacteroidia bacterium]